MANEYDEMLKTGSVPSNGNEYFDLVGQDAKTNRQALQGSMYVAAQKDPDQQAKILELSRKTKLPAEVVERNFDEVSKRQRVQENDYDALIKDTPGLASWLQDPNNASIARDDLPALGRIEKATRAVSKNRLSHEDKVYAQRQEALFQFGREIKDSAKTGWLDLNASAIHLTAAYGMVSPDEAATAIADANRRSAELRAKAPDYAKEFSAMWQKEGEDVNAGARQFLSGYTQMKEGKIKEALHLYAEGGGRTVGEILDLIGASVIRPRGLVHTATQSLAHSLPSLVTGYSGAKAGGIGGGVAGGPVGAGVGASAGFVIGSFAGAVPTEVGAWINSSLSERGYDITNPDDIRRAYSDPKLMADVRAEAERKGLTTAAVDVFANAFAGRFLKGVKGKGVGAKVAAGAKELAIQSTGEATSEYLGQVAAVGVEKANVAEAIQEGIASLGHSMGETVITAPLEVRELFSRDPIRAAEEVTLQAREAVEVQHDAEMLKEMGAAVRESKTQGRMPEAVQALIETAAQGGEVQAVYFQSDEWDAYWTSKGLSPAKAASDILGDDGQSYYQAKSQGTQLEIKLPQYISQVAPTEHWEGLLQSARTRSDGMTLAEANTFLNNLPGVMDSLAKEATEPAVEDPSAAVGENISEQLQSAGFTQDTADTNAQLTQAFFRTQAARLNEDPLELFESYGLRISRPDVAQPAEQMAAQDPIFNQARPIEDELQTTVPIPDLVPMPALNPDTSFDGIESSKIREASLNEAKRSSGKQVVSNAHTGRKIKLSKEGLKKSANMAMRPDQAVALRNLGTLIENAVFLRSSQDRNNPKSGITFEYFYAPYTHNGKSYVAKIAVRTGRDGSNFYALHSQEIKNPSGEARSIVPGGEQVSASNPDGSVTATKADLLRFVNEARETTEFFQSDSEEARKARAEAAGFDTSKIWYHGTNRNISEFDPGKMGEGSSVKHSVPAQWLSDNAEVAGEFAELAGESEAYIGERFTNRPEYKALEKKYLSGELTEHDFRSRVFEARRRVQETGQNIIPAWAKVQNPLVIDVSEYEGSYLDPKSRDKFLRRAQRDGHDSVLFKNMSDSPSGIASNVLAVFQPNQIRSVNAKFQDTESPNILFQDENDPRGRIVFGENGIDIELFKKADLSTFLHESGHFYLEVLGDIAAREDAPQSVKDDYATVLKWMGVESRDQIEVKHHEMFARGIEAYLMEGKAPSASLRQAFARFRAWLVSIYKRLTSLNVDLTPEVKGVFDRMFATEEEIREAQAIQGMTPLFSDPRAVGMGEVEAAKYAEAIEEAKLQAEEELQAKLMDAVTRERKAWWKDEKAKVRSEVEAEANANPIYIAMSVLQKGTLPDGTEAPVGMAGLKISREILVEQYGKEFLARLPRPHIYAKDGMHPDLVAEIFGFSSGDELLTNILNVRPREKFIETKTNAIMIERHGDLLNDPSLPSEALKAVHNEMRSKLLRKELEYLASDSFAAFKGLVKKISRPIPPSDVIRDQAQRIVAEHKVRDISPKLYQRAEKQAGKAAVEAFLKGDFEAAFEAKQRELLNHELYRAAVEAQEQVDKTVDFMKRFLKLETRQRLGKAGKEYLDQVDSIMERFDFRRGVSLSQIDQRKSLVQWIEEQRALGFEPVVPDKLLNEAYRQSYKDLSYEELQGIHDFVKNIETLSRLKNRLLKNEQKRDLDEAVDEAVASIEANSKGKRKQEIDTRLPQEEGKRLVDGFFASHRKFSSFMRQMDGFKDNGIMWELFSRPMNEAASREAAMNEEATKKLSEIFGAYSAKEKALWYKKEFIPEIGASLTKMHQFMVALNWGNDDNRQKLMDGRKWNEAQVAAILSRLDERDWKTVQAIWDFIDSYWPETKALNERVSGVAPAKVHASPVQTKYGTYSGGYFPLKYDDRVSPKAFSDTAKEMADMVLRGATVRSTTKHGHRKERVSGVKMPVRLDFGVIFEHVAQVIHDQSHYEYLIDVNRLLGHKKMQDTIIAHYGDQIYKLLKDTVQDIAAGDVPAQSAFEKAINWLRIGTSVSAMGWNLMTALQQPLGLTQSMVRVGPKWAARGISRWIGDATRMESTVAWVHEKSEVMRLRAKTQMREINEVRNSIRPQGPLSAVEDSFFYLIGKAQMIADIPTWLGAYEKAMDELGKSDLLSTVSDLEARAVALADQAVLDAQGGGQTKDLASIQRGGPLKKLWTNFYSFFNTTFNLTAESIGRTNFKDPYSIGRLAVDFLLLYSVPAILGVLLKEAVRGSGDDEDEIMAKLGREQAAYLMGTVVGLRELGSIVQGFRGYEGPAGTRFFSEFGGLVKQAEQGEVDEAFLRSLNKTGGILFHYPAGQIERTFRGFTALQEGQTQNPAAVLVGPPRN